jgi:hypothetical protein
VSTEATIARLRWRSDLLDYSAASLATTDLNAAATKVTAAAQMREEADLIERLTTAKASGNKGDIRTAAVALRAHRQFWRTAAEMNGTRASGGVLDNFTEPSDTELIGA